MFNTLPDWLYNSKKYVSYTWEEFVGFTVTSLFAGFILTFNDWGGEVFDPIIGIQSLLLMFFFLFALLLLTTTICKFLALRFGYVLHYEAHLVALMMGLVIAVASAGYFPLFIPGGFKMRKPMRLYTGHWRGYMRTWETALICGTVPMLMFFYVLILNPLYLWTGNEVILSFVTACLLVAVYSLIPVPNVALDYGGRVLDFFRYFSGMSFGLEVFFNSRTWYVTLATFTLTTAIISWFVAVTQGTIAIWIYIVTMLLALFVLYVYKVFIEKLKAEPNYRY